MERQLTPFRGENVEDAPFRFDPYLGAGVLRKLSEVAHQQLPSRLIDPAEPMYQSAVGVLADAKRWLDQYRTPFEYFAGDLLLAAAIDRLLLINIDTFASTLTSAALELVTVARLVELRDVRASKEPQPPVADHKEKDTQLPTRLADRRTRRFL